MAFETLCRIYLPAMNENLKHLPSAAPTQETHTGKFFSLINVAYFCEMLHNGLSSGDPLIMATIIRCCTRLFEQDRIEIRRIIPEVWLDLFFFDTK